MHELFRVALSLALLVVQSTATAAELPLPPFRASFSVVGLGIPAGDADFILEQAGDNRWRFVARILPNVVARTLGVDAQRQESLFRYQDGTVVPEQFIETRERDDAITATAEFHWQRSVVIITELDTKRRIPIEQRPLYDEASLYVALMLDLKREQLPASYLALGAGKVRNYELQPAGDRRVQTALGPVDTVGVKRERTGHDRRTTLWCAPAYHYLPVLIVQERSGHEVLRMTLTAIEGLEARP